MKKILLPVVLCLGFIGAMSQGEIPVDMTTGNPIIQVPLWTVIDHDLSDPVFLYYDVSRLRLLEQNEGWYGVGWASSGGGYITRSVRGLPDDINETVAPLRKGWLYTNSSGVRVSYDVGNFQNSSNNSVVDCSDESDDNAKIASFNYTIDSEPDVFYFRAPGLSGAFVFDNASTPTIRLIPYQDIKIAYTYSGSKLSSFTITSSNGTVYTFSDVASNTKSTVISPNVTDVTLLQAEYQLYKTPVQYNASWGLTKMQSASGAYIDYTYSTQTTSPQEDVRFGVYNQSNNPPLTQLRILTLYTIKETINRKYISTITGSSGMKMTFDYTGSLFNGVKIYDLRNGVNSSPVKEFSLDYKTISNLRSHRKFLQSVTELSGCDRIFPYTFQYTIADQLPDYQIISRDAWGYYNLQDDGQSSIEEMKNNYHLFPTLYVYPSEPTEHQVRLYPIPNYSGTEIILTGANRRPSAEGMAIGSLNSISYPTGGLLQLQFEANSYYDTRAGVNQLAGGLRIKRINYFDGVNPSGVISKTFEYNDPATGRSYGRLTDMPSFLLPQWKYRNPDYYTNASYDLAYNSSAMVADQWKRYTVRTEKNMNDQGSSPVLYQNVIVRRPGSGSVKFQYLMPAQYAATTTGQWSPTINKFTRPNASPCVTMGIVSGANAWTFPYSPNPNYDHERGLLERKFEYNEAGVLVRDTYNEYQDIYRPGQSSPVKVSGLRYDLYGHSSNIFLFGKYYMLTDIGKVLLRETVTTYDVVDLAKKQTDKTEYTYEGTGHRALSRIRNIRTDGSIYTTKMNYPIDLGAIPANSESALLRIKDLQSTNQNSVPFEVVHYFQRSLGDTLKVLSAELIKYETFSPGGVLPKEYYSLPLTKPGINFTEASSVLQNNTYILKTDSRYELDNTLTAYTSAGHVVSSIGKNKIPSATAWGYSGTLPAATISHVASVSGNNAQFAFSDFETTTGNEFALANAFYGIGYTGSSAIHPYATLTKTVTKASNTQNYVVSFRGKNNSTTPFVVRIKLKSTDLATVYYNDTIKVIANNLFRFSRKSIPVALVPSSFVIEITGEGLSAPTTSASSLFPVIDDVAFYPEQASLVSYTYQVPFGTKSVTSHGQGITTFNEYDNLGRVRLTRDMNLNILSRTTYNAPKYYNLIASMRVPSPLYALQPMTFIATDNPCIDGETYNWMIVRSSSQSTITTSTTSTNKFTYTLSSAGQYTISLKVNASGYPEQTTSQSITAIYAPISVTLCQAGVKEYGCAVMSTVPGGCSGVAAGSQVYASFVAGYDDEVPANPTYQWKKRNVGDNVWTNVGTNSNLYSFKVLPNTSSSEVMCEVSTPEGRKGQSPIRTVIVYPCQ